MKNLFTFSFFVIMLTTFLGIGEIAYCQKKIGDSPYNIYFHPSHTWPKTARTLALGYFNILGDGLHPDFASNPALTADISKIYLSSSIYREPFPTPFGVNYKDHFYLFSGGLKFLDKFGAQVNLSTLKQSYEIYEVTFTGTNIHHIKEQSNAFTLSLGAELFPDILIGLNGNYSEIIFQSSLGGYSISSSALYFDVGFEIRNASNNQIPADSNPIPRAYDKWHNGRIAGYNLAVVLKNIGERQKIGYGIGNSPALPLELKFGLSWLVVNSNKFGFEVFGNYMRDLSNGDYYTGLRRFSYSGAVEFTTFNFVQIRFGHFSITDDLKSFTWGVSVGPPYLRLEYGKIDNFGVFDSNIWSEWDKRDILTLSLNYPVSF